MKTFSYSRQLIFVVKKKKRPQKWWYCTGNCKGFCCLCDLGCVRLRRKRNVSNEMATNSSRRYDNDTYYAYSNITYVLLNVYQIQNKSFAV